MAVLWPVTRAVAQPPEIRIAEGSRALMPVTIGAAASERVKAAAATLAAYLERISGAKFEVKAGDGTSGLAVGAATDFPALALANRFNPQDITRREEYLLRSSATGVHLIGVTELAVEHAVWDFLYRLGYRQFFPNKNWEVVPSIKSLKIAVQVEEQPDWLSRRIWWTYGQWPENARPNQEWNSKNRATAGFDLNIGHAYGAIIKDNKKEFDAHPEYFALINGERKPGPQGKFCISNAGLRKLVADHAICHFEKNSGADSISVDPSDGGGWCECAECAKLGSVSTRVTILANQVAGAINAKVAKTQGEKFVGFYAYNFHSPPPTVRVPPNVIVSVATAFLKGGLSVDQIIEGWQKQGARMLGIREYFSIIHWDQDLPGRAKAANVRNLAASIINFHDKKARFMSAESSDNWGPNGLGYYVASRVLWDSKEATRVEVILDDFYTKAFGPAQAPIAGVLRVVHQWQIAVAVRRSRGRHVPPSRCRAQVDRRSRHPGPHQRSGALYQIR